jgi:1-acyl-sn-glycerol-3-phosphate acyltransferase
VAAAKAMIPLESWRRECSRTLNVIAENWIWVNTLNQKLTSNTRWVVEGIENLERSQWYLVLANHQSWVDILVMQRVFYRKIPLLKFFLKKELFRKNLQLWLNNLWNEKDRCIEEMLTS